ncbi:hypothetical protein SORBI_3010G133275 [Sorghum bicolor]|uniref:C2H2-type domain-containing protein n=1 Tax=Sorghum bicolor TaxID=4558 RepID=A0A1W0VSS7_SORBI|nr:hypothetical protein SORBI_3010G133275 [Sorghum bicolor]
MNSLEAMAIGTKNGGSNPKQMTSLLQPLPYKCYLCPKSFKNTQGRGGHMAKYHSNHREMRRKNEEHVDKKRKSLIMEMLPPNKEYWMRYHNGKVIPYEFVFKSVKADSTLPREVESSECLSLHQSMNDKKVKIQDKGYLDTNKVDLTLKL